VLGIGAEHRRRRQDGDRDSRSEDIPARHTAAYEGGGHAAMATFREMVIATAGLLRQYEDPPRQRARGLATDLGVSR
jgi:hypothetical protein